MKSKKISIDGKDIVVYDDVLTYSEHNKAFVYALESRYGCTRSAIFLPENNRYQKTLACYMSLNEVLKHGVLSNKTILHHIKQNKLRLTNYYINLCTSNDVYVYHQDDSEDVGNQTLLCYLNTTWHPTWEGETHFSDDSSKEILFASSFIPGRVLIFDSSIPHKSSQPSFDSEQFRFVVAAKMVAPDSALYDTGINIEDFVYNKSEIINIVNPQEKKAIQFLKSVVGDVKHSDTTLFAHLLNTFCILKTHNASADVCLAGLFHSIYGTTYFKPNIDIDKSKVVEMIGEKAESLVSYFCSEGNIEQKIINNAFKLNNMDWLGLLQIFYANGIEQHHRLPFHFKNQPNTFALVKNKIEELTKENKNNE